MRDHSELTQDKRLRALERELLRSGKSLYEWAAAVIDVPVQLQLMVPSKHILSHEMDGIRLTITNNTPNHRRVEFSVSPRVPSLFRMNSLREMPSLSPPLVAVLCPHGVPEYDFCRGYKKNYDNGPPEADR